MSSHVVDDQSSEPANEAQRVGVVGLGSIGSGIALCLARRGRVLAVHDLRPDAADGLDGVPAALGSPAEVARVSDVVIVAVVDADQVTDVVVGREGLLSGAHPGLVILVTATISVAPIRSLAEVCERHGVTLLDCAVTRGSRAADHGLRALVGGPDDVVRRVMPVLDDLAERVFHCGPLGAGMACKLASQIVTAGRWRAVHEAVELGAAAGVDPAIVVEVIDVSDPEGTATLGLQRLRMADRRVDAFARPVQNYFRNVDKDMAAAEQLASDLGVAIPLVDLTRARSSDTFAWLDEPPG